MDILGLTQVWHGLSASPGGGVFVPPPAPPENFLDAVRQRFLAGPRAGDFTGVYLGEASRRAAFPYVVAETTGSTLELKTSTSEVQAVRFRFRVYAEDLDAAEPLAAAIQALYGPPLTFAGGWSTQWTCEGTKQQIDAYRSRSGADVWFVAVDFRTRVKTGGTA